MQMLCSLSTSSAWDFLNQCGPNSHHFCKTSLTTKQIAAAVFASYLDLAAHTTYKPSHSNWCLTSPRYTWTFLCRLSNTRTLTLAIFTCSNWIRLWHNQTISSLVRCSSETSMVFGWTSTMSPVLMPKRAKTWLSTSTLSEHQHTLAVKCYHLEKILSTHLLHIKTLP